MKIPLDFIKKFCLLTWEEASWGFQHQYLGWKDLVELANNNLDRNNINIEIIELAGLGKEDAGLAGEFLEKLTNKVSPEVISNAQRKWLFFQLAWIFSTRDDIDDPLGEVEKVYAEFDYPREIENFVRYMPAEPDYDPSKHSREDNEKRLFSLWEQYLIKVGAQIGCLWIDDDNKSAAI